jgi:dihydrofolate reductase
MGDDEGVYKFDELKAADAMLLGRITYKGFAVAWPTMQGTGEFGERMNSLPKHVVTSSLTEFGWNNSQALDGDLETGVRQLKDTYQNDILVMGSGVLVRQLLALKLVDELRLMTYPIMLGEGYRLLEGVSKMAVKLVSTKTFVNGTVVLTYTQNA